MKVDLKDPQNWVSRDIFEVYCGDGSDKLLSYYDKAVEKKKIISISLNWLAILAIPAWLGYRKQWNLLIIFTVLIASLPFLEAIFKLNLTSAGFGGGLLGIGLMSNGFLLSVAQNEFMKLKKNGLSEEQIKAELQDKASPSVSMAFAGLGLNLIVIFASDIVADLFFGLPY